ncbi:Uncharacterised protein [uncultured archaeon]|nr:Uncharacterised protein [uncultured archaeon]
MIKQISSYGRTRTDKESFIETLKKPFFLVPLLFCVYLAFLLIFVCLEFFNINLIPNLILFLPLGLYFILDLFFSGYESAKNKNLKATFLLLFIFPLIHISYGLGMIQGYLKNKN